jgi:hypothetical protein
LHLSPVTFCTKEYAELKWHVEPREMTSFVKLSARYIVNAVSALFYQRIQLLYASLTAII